MVSNCMDSISGVICLAMTGIGDVNMANRWLILADINDYHLELN